MKLKKAFVAVAAAGAVGAAGAGGYMAGQYNHTDSNSITFDEAFSPHQGATALVVKTIKEARKSVHVAGYSFTSKPIAEALVAAHDKGIDVEVVLDKSQAGSDMAKYVEAHGIPTLINYKYAIMHDKFMVIDGVTVELGSFNYTASAENRNAENVLVIHGADKVARDYDNQWKKLWAEAKSSPPNPGRKPRIS